MPLENGAVFAGYVIQRQLGSGGMGEVYLAQHPRLARLDVLKILAAALTEDADFRRRFDREADLAAALRHPNIVGLHDRGEFDGRLWLTMDYVDGIDTARAVRERGALPAAQVVEIVTAVADALDFAHQRNLLHCNVKPENILLSNADAGRHRILLAGFGIGRRGDDVSGAATVGSVAYAAPEQLTGRPTDGRADQYALAATAFHLLTGEPPFQDSSAAVVVGQQLNAPPPLLARRRPELAAMDPVLSTALAKDPAHRYPRCLDFAHALSAAAASANPTPPAAPWQAAGPPVFSYPPPYPHPYPPAPASQLRLAAIVVPLILLLVFLGAAGFALTQVLRPDPRPSTAAPQWQPYVDYAKQFSVWLMTISPQSADSDVQRIMDGSTGQFHDEFANANSDFRKAIVSSNVTTQGTVDAAGLDAISGTTAKVLVAATAKVTNDNGAVQEPRRFRFLMQVERLGEAYKVSKVEFVP